MGCASEQQGATPAPRLGIQLYTLRTVLAEDLPGTLARLGEIGYQEVELFDGVSTPAPELKRMLADAGLVAPSAHVGRERIRDNPGPQIERGAEMGYEYLVLNWLAPEERATIDQYKAWADTANAFAASCRDAGMKFCWHNHDFEFLPIEGVVPYSVLLERCDPELVGFQLDLYWASKAGVDILAHLAAHGARTKMVHVKDMDRAGAMADVGAGIIDFGAIFAAHAFEHYYVEHDSPADPIASVTASYGALSAILKDPRT